MMKDKARDYLAVADVLGMYTILMKRYGGETGIRDPGALESAIFRPMTGYYHDAISEAAALMESLAINHPFIDGNKRNAFAAADVFLRINGWRLMGESSEIYSHMISLCYRRVKIDHWGLIFARRQQS